MFRYAGRDYKTITFYVCRYGKVVVSYDGEEESPVDKAVWLRVLFPDGTHTLIYHIFEKTDTCCDFTPVLVEKLSRAVLYKLGHNITIYDTPV